jgi:hypothetical protein
MKINFIGIAAGILVLAVLFVSLYVPWWQLIVGENLIEVNASPVNTNFGLLGAGFTVPLIFALNLISILGLAASGIMMLLYSFLPDRHYSKHLIGFAYRKPLYILVGFLVGLVVSVFIVGAFGIKLPFLGSTAVTLPTNFTLGATVSTTVSASFQFPIYLAIVAAVLSIAARIYHGRALTPVVREAEV